MNLKRELEPEVMDTAEEARDYNEMDHSEVNRLFVDDLIKFSAARGVQALGDILDLGTGTALIPIELCRRMDDCRVMAIDMAIEMLELARYNVEANGFVDRITLGQVDAKKMEFEDGAFDVVISNSIIHHIPEPEQCVRELDRVTAEGGLVFVRDLARPIDEQVLESQVAIYAGDENEHSQRMFRESLHAALRLDEIRELIAPLGYEPETVQMTSDRHWTWMAIKK